MASPALQQFNTPIDPVQVARLVITPAQFLAFDGNTPTSQIVVPAPGLSKLIEVLSYSVNMQFPPSGGIAYATGTQPLILGADATGVVAAYWATMLPSASPGIKAAASSYQSGFIAFAAGGNPVPNFVNRALLVNILFGGASYTAGNSPFVLTVRYRIIDAT